MKRRGYTIIEALVAGSVGIVVAAASATLLFYTIRRQAEFTACSFALHQVARLTESIREDAALAEHVHVPDAADRNEDNIALLIVLNSMDRKIRYESTGSVIRRIETAAEGSQRYEVFDVKGLWTCRFETEPFQRSQIVRATVTPTKGISGGIPPRGRIVVEEVIRANPIDRGAQELDR
ncbi:hypothetical protein JCM19992_19550 [Thermostilla marina]